MRAKPILEIASRIHSARGGVSASQALGSFAGAVFGGIFVSIEYACRERERPRRGLGNNNLEIPFHSSRPRADKLSARDPLVSLISTPLANKSLRAFVLYFMWDILCERLHYKDLYSVRLGFIGLKRNHCGVKKKQQRDKGGMSIVGRTSGS